MEPHAAGPRRPLVFQAVPDDLAPPADQLEAVAEAELEVEHGPGGLGHPRADEHAAGRDVRRVLADETVETVELELHARFKRNAPRVAGDIRVVDHVTRLAAAPNHSSIVVASKPESQPVVLFTLSKGDPSMRKLILPALLLMTLVPAMIPVDAHADENRT